MVPFRRNQNGETPGKDNQGKIKKRQKTKTKHC
jgi:hypothetical protein